MQSGVYVKLSEGDLPDRDLADVFKGVSRILAPKELLAYRVPNWRKRLTHKEAFRKPLNLTFYRHEMATVRTLLESSGFTVWMEAMREPDDGERARQAYLIVQRH
jgi:hypothetical protein